MEIRDINLYRKDLDDFGQRTTAFAIAWADSMEALFSRGQTLQNIARMAAQDVQSAVPRRRKLTPHMYGRAVVFLVRNWRHGEALRAWNNVDLLGITKGPQATRRNECINPCDCNQVRP